MIQFLEAINQYPKTIILLCIWILYLVALITDKK